MVKIKGPMMSLDASGSLADALVFSTWKGQPYVRTLVTPTNPKSPAQLGMRAMLAFLSHHWIILSLEDKTTWAETALNANISPFNAYLAYNLTRWRSFKGPTNTLPAVEAANSATATPTLTGGQRHVLLSIANVDNPSNSPAVILRSTAIIITPNWNLAVAVINTLDDTIALFTDAPLAAGTYHYRCANGDSNGNLGAWSADLSAVVT